MQDAEVKRILDASGFSKSEMPFKYLGIPICNKRISKAECEILLSKMVQRIRTWSTRNISFAGRATLINSVLITIHSYWSQIMILPKKVLHKVNSICRSFLWKGEAEHYCSGYVAWDKICTPKKEGGLGFRNIFEWNVAAIGKYIWAIATKQDNLWIKWIHNVYLKEKEWWAYEAPPTSSWYWRQIVTVKNKFKSVIDIQKFISLDYSISQGYQALCPSRGNVYWHSEVWGRLNIPKQRFILWLASLKRLQTKEHLHRINVCEDNLCLVCGAAVESIDHPFFTCENSRRCISELKTWLSWCTAANTADTLLRWIRRSRESPFRKQVFAAVIAAAVYVSGLAKSK